MEYNPKWIVVSNNDMYKIDDVESLKEELDKMRYKEVSTVFTAPSIYHSFPVKLAKHQLSILIFMKIRNEKKG